MSIKEVRTRRALTIGVSRFRGGNGGGSDVADELPDLPFAPALVDELAQALGRLGYPCTVHGAAELSTRALGAAVDQHLASTEANAVLVVHVLSHGQAAEGDATVYVLGSDGIPHRSSDIAHWLTSAQNAPDGPLTLFLLDLCQSGSQARLAWQAAVADGRSRSWVIAACRGQEAAYDGRFTRAVTNVLRAIAGGDLHVDPARAYVPLETVARAVRREVHRLAGDGYQQQVTGSLIDISAEVDLPFFPNPAHDPGNPDVQLRARLDPGLVPFLDDLDEGLDARHFVDRAAGVGALTDGVALSGLVGCFTGRDSELKCLSPWLNRVGSGSLGVVTGSPGVGKSALLGVLVCAAHPRLRQHTRAVWNHVAQAPYPIDGAFAAVHARQRTLATIVASIARQLGLDEPTSAAELISRVCALPEPAVIVVDALDEADDAVSVMTELLLPMVAVNRRDHDCAARVLVGTRWYGEYAPLLAAAEADGLIVDLDDIPRDVLEKDLNRYVYELLGATSEYRELGAVRGGFATTVARALAAAPTERLEHRWGEFLVAGLYTRYLITAHPEPIRDVMHAERLGTKVPRTLPEVLELDLAARPDHPLLRPVMAALAHAHGNGMPASVLARAVAVFSEPDARPPTAAELRVTLEAGRFYLRQTSDTDHSIIYRLFHQGLADYLRRHPRNRHARADRAAGQHLLARMLEPLGPPAARDWNAAEPYLLRHALQHVEHIAAHNELLNDPGFLLAVDDEAINAADPAGGGRFAGSRQRILAVRRATMESTASPLERPAALALNAARARLPELATRAANPPGQPPLTWQPQWTVGRPWVGDPAEQATPGSDYVNGLGPALLSGRHAGAVTALSCGTVGNRPIAITGGVGGTVRLWDLTAHRQVDEMLIEPSTTIVGVACAEIDTLPVALTVGRNDFTVGLWDLREHRLIGRLSHPDQVGAIACATVDGQSIAVVATGRTIQLWDLRARMRLGGPLAGHTKPVTAVCCTNLDGRPVAVTGSADRTIRVWDLRERQSLCEPLAGHRRKITALACCEIDDRAIAITTSLDGTIQMWDLGDQRPYHEPLPAIPRVGLGGRWIGARAVFGSKPMTLAEQNHVDPQRLRLATLQQAMPADAMACTTLNGQPVAVLGDLDGRVSIWRMTTESSTDGNQRSNGKRAGKATLNALFPESGNGIHTIQHMALTTDRSTVLVADTEGTAAAVNLATGVALHGAVHSAGVPLSDIWCHELAGRQVAVLAAPSGTRVWDLTDGEVIDASGLTALPSGNSHPLNTVALMNGTLIAISGHSDGTIRLHESATHRALGYLLPSHEGPVTALAAMELNGRLLAFSGGTDHTLCVWDVATRRRLDTIRMLAEVTAIETTADGHLLVAAGEVIAFRHIDFLHIDFLHVDAPREGLR